jgi:hypothetical protein
MIGQVVRLIEEMPTEKIGVGRRAPQHSFPVSEDLTEKRLSDRMEIYQIYRSTGLLSQQANEREFLIRRERAPRVHGKIEITFPASFASSQRTKHNSQPDLWLRDECRQDRVCQSWVLGHRRLRIRAIYHRDLGRQYISHVDFHCRGLLDEPHADD